jgi:hypothetical protein
MLIFNRSKERSAFSLRPLATHFHTVHCTPYIVHILLDTDS